MEKKTCPYCGEEIMATAKKCKHCGEWLEIEQTTPTSSEDTLRSDSMDDGAVDRTSALFLSEVDQEYYDKGFVAFYGNRIWEKYRFTSSGSVSRGEYWKFTLVTGLILYFAFNTISLLVTFFNTTGLGVSHLTGNITFVLLNAIYLIGASITCTCMVIRRLHDTGKSGWLSVLGFIPLINIVLIILLCQKGADVDPKAKATAKDYAILIGIFVASIVMEIVDLGMNKQYVSDAVDIENVYSTESIDSNRAEDMTVADDTDEDDEIFINEESLDGLDAYDDISDCDGHFEYKEPDWNGPAVSIDLQYVNGKVKATDLEIYREGGIEKLKAGYKNGLLLLEGDFSGDGSWIINFELYHREPGCFVGKYTITQDGEVGSTQEVILKRVNN